MATSLITNYFRLHNVKQFVESISESANSVYYVFTAKSEEYEGGDNAGAPDILNTVETVFQKPFEQMVFGKRVGVSDVRSMIVNRAWASGTVYTPYRSDTVLDDTPYYVHVQETEGGDYHVYKCLDNNNGSQSTVAPSYSPDLAEDEYIQTVEDSYVWKYMYSIPDDQYQKFATADYIPVIPNANVSGNAVSGAIDLITVTSGGSHYDTYFTNTFVSSDIRLAGNNVVYAISDNAHPDNDFYTGSYIYITSGTAVGQGRRIVDYVVTGGTKYVEIDYPFSVTPVGGDVYEITPGVIIRGDGANAEARALVGGSSNTITQIQILNRGRNYTWATAEVTGNTSGYSNNAVIVPIMGPKGGHGSDVEYELGATTVGISVSFEASEGNTVPTSNDYRQIGLLKDPLFANVTLSLNTPVSGTFTVGDTVTQNTDSATAKVDSFDGGATLVLTDVNGVFTTGSTVSTGTGSAEVTAVSITGFTKTFSTFDQRYRYTYNSLVNDFDEDEPVYQTDAQITSAVFHSRDADYLTFTNVRGVLNTGNNISGTINEGTANLLFAYPPDIKRGSGEVMYLENLAPISRSNNQTETVKIILKF